MDSPWHKTGWLSLAQQFLFLKTPWAHAPEPWGPGYPRKNCTTFPARLDLCSWCWGRSLCLAQQWMSERQCLVALCKCVPAQCSSLFVGPYKNKWQCLWSWAFLGKNNNLACLSKLISSWKLLLLCLPFSLTLPNTLLIFHHFNLQHSKVLNRV